MHLKRSLGIKFSLILWECIAVWKHNVTKNIQPSWKKKNKKDEYVQIQQHLLRIPV